MPCSKNGKCLEFRTKFHWTRDHILPGVGGKLYVLCTGSKPPTRRHTTTKPTDALKVRVNLRSKNATDYSRRRRDLLWKVTKRGKIVERHPGGRRFIPIWSMFWTTETFIPFPVKIPHLCEDTQSLFQRFKAHNLHISSKLQNIQSKRAESNNKGRLEQPLLQIGCKVWYNTEVQPGHDKTDTYWKGPGKVLLRVG